MTPNVMNRWCNSTGERPTKPLHMATNLVNIAAAATLPR
jgi:hypothetical protein